MDKVIDGVVVFVALVLAVLATVGASAAFAVFADVIPYIGILSPLVLVAGLVLAFLPMYYVFPDAEVGVRDVLPGTVLAALGWAVFQGLFQVYLAFGDPGIESFFGVVVVVTYLYVSALVLLLGGVVNAVTGDHSAGQPGGVGRGAAEFEPKREEYLGRSEVDAYLRGLDEQLTARYDPARPGADDLNRPQPEEGVRLTEYESVAGDDREWRVELAWSVDEPDRRRSNPPGGD